MRAAIYGILSLHTEDFHGLRPALISAYLESQAVRSGFSRLRSRRAGQMATRRTSDLLTISLRVLLVGRPTRNK